MARGTLFLCAASALLISGGGADAAASDDDDTCSCAPGKLCNKVCDGFNRECAPDVIDCPAGSPCHISCAGFNGLRQQACWGKTIRCARGFPCIVTCTGKDACRGLQIESGGSGGLAGGEPNVALQCETPNVCNDYKRGQSYSCEHITIDGRKQSLVEMLRGLSNDGGCKPAWKGLGVKVESSTGNATELFGVFEAGLEGLFPEGETKVTVRVLCTVEDVTGYKTGRCFVRGTEPVEVFSGILEGSPVVYLDSEVRTESAVMAATVGRIQEALRYRSVRRGPLARVRAASAGTTNGGTNASAPGREAAVLAGDDDAAADALAFPAPLSFDDGNYVAVTQKGGDPAGTAGAYSPRTVETFAEARGISPGAPATMADPPAENDSVAVIVATAMVTLCCVALIGGVLVIRGKRSATTGKARRSNVVPEAKAGEILGQQNMQFLLAAEEAEMNLNAFYQQEMGQIVDGSPLSPTLSNRGGVEGNKDDCCSRSSSGASIAMICHTLSQNTPPREFSPAHYPPRRAHHRIGHQSPGGIGR